MFSILLSAFPLMALCVIIHAAGLAVLQRRVRLRMAQRHRLFSNPMWLLVRVAGFTILLHLLQVCAWGAYYAWNGAMPDFTTALYFSAVTYTTTGYGDLVLPAAWRIAGGVEALTGILMCGLSTGLYFSVFSSLVRSSRHASSTDPLPNGD